MLTESRRALLTPRGLRRRRRADGPVRIDCKDEFPTDGPAHCRCGRRLRVPWRCRDARNPEVADVDDAREPCNTLEERAELMIAAFGGEDDRDLRVVVAHLSLFGLEQGHGQPCGVRRVRDGAIERRRLALV